MLFRSTHGLASNEYSLSDQKEVLVPIHSSSYNLPKKALRQSNGEQADLGVWSQSDKAIIGNLIQQSMILISQSDYSSYVSNVA